MRILAVDTATTSCSVALIDTNRLLGEITVTKDQTHARHIMTVIDRVLDLTGIGITEIDGFAATSGPGTFTGMRIGISTVKGLASATGKPVVGVSSLEALAWQSTDAQTICPMIDARRKEVYFAGYQFVNGRPRVIVPEQVSPPERIIRLFDTGCHFIGNGALLHRNLITGHFGAAAVCLAPFNHTIRASTIAFLSTQMLSDTKSQPRDRISPCYLRLSDAETALKNKA